MAETPGSGCKTTTNREKDMMVARPFWETVELISQESTTHGVGHIWNNRFNPMGIFWLIITVILGGYMWVSVVEVFVDFAKREVKSQTTTLMAEYGLQLPSVALCNRAYFSKKKLADLNITDKVFTSYLVAITGSMSVVKEDFFMKEDARTFIEDSDKRFMDLLQEQNFTLEEFVDAVSVDCEDILVMCSLGDLKVSGKKCCEHVIPVPTLSGKCYVFYTDNSTYNVQRVEGEFLGTSLYFSINTTDYPVVDPKIIDYSQIMKTSLQISVISNQTHPAMAAVSHGVAMSPYYYTTTGVSLSVVKDIGEKRLYDWFVTECLEPGSVNYLTNRENFFLTDPNCDIGAIRACFMNSCNCSTYGMDYTNASHQPCKLGESMRCQTLSNQYFELESEVPSLYRVFNITKQENDDYRSCYKRVFSYCRRPCERYDYQYTTSRSRIHKTIYDNLKEEFNFSEGQELAVATIFFPNLRFTEIRLWRASFSDLISTIGGITGVLLGCSIVSFIEIFLAIVIFCNIFLQFCKSRKASSEVRAINGDLTLPKERDS